jgi:hypothetical protein
MRAAVAKKSTQCIIELRTDVPKLAKQRVTVLFVWHLCPPSQENMQASGENSAKFCQNISFIGEVWNNRNRWNFIIDYLSMHIALFVYVTMMFYRLKTFSYEFMPIASKKYPILFAKISAISCLWVTYDIFMYWFFFFQSASTMVHRVNVKFSKHIEGKKLCAVLL